KNADRADASWLLAADHQPDRGGVGPEAARIRARSEAAVPVGDRVGLHFYICGKGHAPMESGLLEVQGELELPVFDHRRGTAPTTIDMPLAHRAGRRPPPPGKMRETVTGEVVRGRSAHVDALVGDHAGEIQMVVDA